MSRQLLTDSIPLSGTLRESIEELPDGRIRVSGKFQHCDVKNRNGRIYPRRVWEQHCSPNSDFMQAIKSWRVFGHLEHPADGKSHLKEAAIVITNISLRENGEVHGSIETLSTLTGQTAKALLRDGLSVGISSRARGSVRRNAEGIDEVQEDFVPETFDLVAEPSTPGAFLHESLQEKLRAKSPEDLKEQEQAAKLQVQIRGLQEECTVEGWNDTWEGRYNDLVFMGNHLLTPQDSIKMGLRLLDEAIKMKRKIYKNWKVNLVETAEAAANAARAAAEKAQGAAVKAAAVVGTDGNTAETEAAAAQATIAAGEAEAALKVAKQASTPEGAAAAANIAQAAAEKAKDAAERAETVPAPEDSVPAPEVLPEAPPETVSDNDGDISHTVECSFPLTSLSDATRKKINIFRVGEESENLLNLIQSALEDNVKSIDTFWVGDKLCIKVAVANDPEGAKAQINSLMLSGQGMPVEMGDIPEEPEDFPEEAEEVEPDISVPEGYSGSIRARDQVIHDLNEEIQTLKKTAHSLITDNGNLRMINQEMVGMFEEELTKVELGRLLKECKELVKFKGFLSKCKTLPSLQETAGAFLKALNESSPSNRKGNKGKVHEPISSGAISSFDEVGLQVPLDLNEAFMPPELPPQPQAVTVSDGPAPSDNIFGRLAKHRKRKK